jgi:hypothetical protein
MSSTSLSSKSNKSEKSAGSDSIPESSELPYLLLSISNAKPNSSNMNTLKRMNYIKKILTTKKACKIKEKFFMRNLEHLKVSKVHTNNKTLLK